jgi:hypothetical protein
VYISIAHTIHISLYFFIILFKFYKNTCKEMCTNHDLFFLLVDINLNHNVILYFFITLLILYNYISSKCIFSLVLRYLKKKNVNYIMYINNILFNKKNVFF